MIRRIIFLALLLCGSLQAQVVYEATGSISAGYFGAPPVTSFSITLGGASTTRAVMVAFSMSGGAAPAGLAVTVGGVSASAVSGASGGTFPFSAIYCVATTLTGAQNVVITWTSGSRVVSAGAISATGVNQTTPCTNGATTSGASPTSLSITSVSGDLTATMAWAGQATTTNRTSKWTSSQVANGYFSVGDVGPGTGTTSHTWTTSTGSQRLVGANFLNATVTVATPTFGTAAGTYSTSLPRSTTITTATSGATICYTIDGTTVPTAGTPGTCDATGTGGGTEFSLTNGGSITLATTRTIKAIGSLVGDVNSATATAAYVINISASTVNGMTVGPAIGNITKINGLYINPASGYVGSINGLVQPITATTVDALFDAHGGTNNGTPTGTTLGNSTYGQVGHQTWNVASIGANVQYTTAAHLADLPKPVNVGGTVYSGNSTLGVQCQTNGSGTGCSNFFVQFDNSTSSLSVGFWFKWTCPNGSSQECGAWIGPNNAGADYAVLHLGRSGCPTCVGHMYLEAGPGEGSNFASVSANTLYRVNIQMNKGPTATQQMVVCDASNNYVGYASTVGSSNTNNPLLISFGNTGEEPTVSGYFYYWSNHVISMTGAFSATQCIL